MAAIAGAGIAMAAKNAAHMSFWGDIILCALMMIGSVCITAESFKDILKNIFWMWIVTPVVLIAVAVGVKALWHLIM